LAFAARRQRTLSAPGIRILGNGGFSPQWIRFHRNWLQLPGILRGLHTESLFSPIQDALIISAAVILIRIAWVLPATYLPRLFSKKLRRKEPIPPWQQVTVVAWSGMRGVVSLAAAFALPLALTDGTTFPGRNYILFLTFSVILATLVLQGLTLPLLIRKLRIKGDNVTDEEARLEANQAALALIGPVAENHGFPSDVINRLRAEYDERIEQLQLRAGNPEDCSGEIATPQYQRLQYDALQNERQTIIRLRNEHVINDEALRRIQRDLDLAEARLTGD
jgi:NhaP-type Na+/H+ or K+/H+ antiporter